MFEKKLKILTLFLLVTLTIQLDDYPFYEHLEAIPYLSNICSSLSYEKKLILIDAKKSVTDDTIQQKKVKDQRFTFLGKGGYSRVFFDEVDKVVVKVIKARKLKSITALRSITDELLIGFEYFFKSRYPGTPKSCSFALKSSQDKFDMFIMYMDLLVGYDMKLYINNYQEEENLDLEQSLYTIKNLNMISNEFHNMGYFHRDIKPGNFFLLKDKTSKDGFKPILIDFAFSLRQNYNTRYKGTRKYMPKEMLVGNKKSDWYNNTIDVFNSSVSYMEYIFNFLWDKQVDFSLGQILNGSLYDNWCVYYKEYQLDDFYNFKFVFCDNSDHYWQKFKTLPNLIGFFKNKKKTYCTQTEVQNTKNIFWDNREENLIKCYNVDKENKNFVMECRPTMADSKKIFDLYYNWRFFGTTIMYKKYELVFENQRLMDLDLFVDKGFLGIMYRFYMPNLYRMIRSRHVWSTSEEE